MLCDRVEVKFRNAVVTFILIYLGRKLRFLFSYSRKNTYLFWIFRGLILQPTLTIITILTIIQQKCKMGGWNSPKIHS